MVGYLSAVTSGVMSVGIDIVSCPLRGLHLKRLRDTDEVGIHLRRGKNVIRVQHWLFYITFAHFKECGEHVHFNRSTTSQWRISTRASDQETERFY